MTSKAIERLGLMKSAVLFKIAKPLWTILVEVVNVITVIQALMPSEDAEVALALNRQSIWLIVCIISINFIIIAIFLLFYYGLLLNPLPFDWGDHKGEPKYNYSLSRQTFMLLMPVGLLITCFLFLLPRDVWSFWLIVATILIISFYIVQFFSLGAWHTPFGVWARKKIAGMQGRGTQDTDE